MTSPAEHIIVESDVFVTSFDHAYANGVNDEDPTAVISEHSFGQISKSGDDSVTAGEDIIAATVVEPTHKLASVTKRE